MQEINLIKQWPPAYTFNYALPCQSIHLNKATFNKNSDLIAGGEMEGLKVLTDISVFKDFPCSFIVEVLSCDFHVRDKFPVVDYVIRIPVVFMI